jgi:phosphatidylglycerophosphatase A
MKTLLSKKMIITLTILGIAVVGIVVSFILSGQSLCGVPADDLMGMLAISFGLGCVPLIPGTAGALGGIILSLMICRLSIRKQLIAVTLLILVAIPICDYGETYFDGKDASQIVADELFTFPVATIGLPIHQYTVMLAGIFMTNRIIDWTKPPPARAAESLPGGVGVVLDDVVASLWTLLLFSIGWRWYRRASVKRDTFTNDD